MNYDVITIEDCLDMYEKRHMVTIIEDGRIVRFEEEVSNTNHRLLA